MPRLGRIAVLAAVVFGFTAMPGAAHADPLIVGNWQMNEPAGATTMNDASTFDNDGRINQAGLDTGVVFGGATGYRWAFRSPTAPPPAPERVIQVPENNSIDAGSGVFTIEIRFRTDRSFGNITQKGQATSAGGQWKIQNPGGRPSCLFRGSSGTVATRSPVTLNNNQWHTLRCVRTATRVSMYIDGSSTPANFQNGASGTINNTLPMTVGGKINCNQQSVTCDYFTGHIDYIRLSKGT